VITIVILAHLHIIQDPHYLLGVVSAVILIMSEQFLESDKQIRKQATAIESVIENTSPRLYKLHDCVKDIDDNARQYSSSRKSHRRASGFGSDAGMQDFEKVLRKHQHHLTDVDYRLLILTDETEKICGQRACLEFSARSKGRSIL
jgi:hypothetical protein